MADDRPDTAKPVEQKCAHPSCSCAVPAGTKYCSDYCKRAPQIELHCNCMHAKCHL